MAFWAFCYGEHKLLNSDVVGERNERDERDEGRGKEEGYAEYQELFSKKVDERFLKRRIFESFSFVFLSVDDGMQR